MSNIQEVFKNRIIGFTKKSADQLLANPLNFRTHPQAQREAVNASLRELGWIAAVVENVRTGHLIDGHERVWQALAANEDVPVLQVDLSEDEERLALAIFDPISAMAGVDAEILENLHAQLNTEEPALLALLAKIERENGLGAEEAPLLGVEKNAKPNPRKLALDVIYTLQGADASCCLAVLAGLRYGIQSATFRLCPYHDQLSGRHEVWFVDNDYFAYDHARHLEVVARFNPKYATVRDLMTREQCNEAGIEYFDKSQILEWAEELREHAQNVIVIPKYDCLDEIPDHFVLGYSVPSSHGGTPLPVARFKERRVHLLGGSWKAQLAHMAELGDAVVSVDNNHVSLIASQWAQFYDPDGNCSGLSEAGFGSLTNPRYVALAMSFGAMAAKVNEIYSNAAIEPQ